eukprot:TRINITY_DN465_c1_g1_i4.p1 TRINITY_DN465_c1_g1~~TRINITY_DN465_c1_g1_i4.p1  ORF type:complete len:738 (+),score=141.69 TRINITY_DN465_c1_g1_i4:97-2310(+)
MVAGSFASITALFTLLHVGLRDVAGHGYMSLPPARNAVSGVKNGYCPHCGNGNGICGDGNQWPSDSNYINEYAGTVAEWRAGTVVEVKIKISAHHKGHFEFSICDQVINSNLANPQECLNTYILERAAPSETGIADCNPAGDTRGGCQPLDLNHKERFYLPPPGFSTDGAPGDHTIFLKVPSDLSCEACTLQWRWWSANSKIPGPDYLCYYNKLVDLSNPPDTTWDAADWGLNKFGADCPGGGCGREGACGEEFRNCADIKILPALGGTVTTTAQTQTTQGQSTTSVTSQAGSTTTTAAATTTTTTTTTASVPGPECVSHAVLTCINGKSSFWPKCDPEQSKSSSIAGPAGYEYGFYCTQRWSDALNLMLSDSAVDKCNDRQAVHKLLAQVAYETGYFSTVYQPADGGAGLIHMIPNNWPINAADMDSLFPNDGGHYAGIAAAMGKDFFQSADYGWKSVAAWFKLTNRVIGGCGLNLFDQSFQDQTRCILGSASDRQEAYDIVAECLPSEATTTTAAGTTTTTAATTAATTTTTTTTIAQSCNWVSSTAEFGTTNERCAAACQVLVGSWPCLEAGTSPCKCETISTTSEAITSTQFSTTVGRRRTTATTTTTTTTTTPTTPPTATASPTTTTSTTTTSGDALTCFPTPGMPAAGQTEENCATCATGNANWPCNTDPAICTCTGPGITTTGISLICSPTPGEPDRGQNEENCATCAIGYSNWPCNVEPPICTCSEVAR